MNRLELEKLLIETFGINDQAVLDSLYIYYEMLYETSNSRLTTRNIRIKKRRIHNPGYMGN